MSRILPKLCLLAGFIATSAMGQTLSTTSISLGHPANGDVERVGEYLAVSGHSAENRWLSLIGLDDFSHLSVEIPSDAQFFGRMKLADEANEQLVFLTQEGLRAFSPQHEQHRALVEFSSIYPLADRQRLRFKDFARDVTGSGLSDLLIPDFKFYHLIIQQANGEFESFRLNVDAQVRTTDTNAQFTPRRPYLVDMSLNGKTDVVFVRDGKLLAFFQREDGTFSEDPMVIDPGVGISPDHEANIRAGDGRDFAGLRIYRMHEFQDLDGDGLADLVVREESFASAVEQDYTYRIHYGREGEAGLEFAAEPDTRIATSGIQFEPVFEDINGNGRKDFYTPSAQFGVGTIIRALLRGSARLDIEFYMMDESRNFPREPTYRHRASADVSIGSGRVDLPLVKVARFDNSGRKSLLVGEGRSELAVYAPVQDGLFERRPTTFSMSLPRDGARARVMDLDHAGIEELVLPFDAQDEEGRRNRVVFLMVVDED
ncbi:VCBS repeat-containing protein [Marinimicrobium sp. ABcell2]|uniref:FG-GAP repeat domain-containing protein n=1 Tax=Marinimicrobium sp. ABcell2 TaxID=3069751 RepID=UPI0027B6348E|nr:VCBS repeat-containing protein [Marinimicrobium sp. ABcell2]MDQ2077310.1 VCBS repeat-containing protein [Marinimicrobium sp. ABcell2]